MVLLRHKTFLEEGHDGELFASVVDAMNKIIGHYCTIAHSQLYPESDEVHNRRSFYFWKVYVSSRRHPVIRLLYRTVALRLAGFYGLEWFCLSEESAPPKFAERAKTQAKVTSDAHEKACSYAIKALGPTNEFLLEASSDFAEFQEYAFGDEGRSREILERAYDEIPATVSFASLPEEERMGILSIQDSLKLLDPGFVPRFSNS